MERIGPPAAVVACVVLLLIALNSPLNIWAEHSRQAAQERAEADQRAAQNAQRDAAACRRAAQCWGWKHWANATIACTQRTDRAARYATRWPSGLLNPAFISWDWRDQKAETLTYIGRVEFQNGFGAWEPYIVGCLYDPATGQDIDIELKPGRL